VPTSCEERAAFEEEAERAGLYLGSYIRYLALTNPIRENPGRTEDIAKALEKASKPPDPAPVEEEEEEKGLEFPGGIVDPFQRLDPTKRRAPKDQFDPFGGIRDVE
jgi:hypothetical protein